MPDKKKQILLISYVFPPYYGIGGRRWAKHAVGLAASGYTVHVICASNPYSKTSLWYDQVQSNPNIVIHALAPKYPYALLNSKPSFVSKLAYKFWLLVLPLLTKRNYYDRSLFWNKSMLAKAKDIIATHNITNLICSGGPFGQMYFVTTLKQEFKQLIVLNDLRDPWTWAPNWGFASLSKKRMDEEQRLEKEMILNSDIVTVPTDGMLNFLTQKYPGLRYKFVKLPHTFDESEIPVAEKTKSDILRLVYYGSVYEGIEKVFESVLSNVSADKTTSIDIFTDAIHKLEYILESHKADNIHAYPAIAPKDLFTKFKDYDAVLMINPAYNIENISTKFYEIIFTRTPIIMISETGMGSQYIANNKLGLHILPDNVKEGMADLKRKLEAMNYNANFDLSAFSLKAITKQICTILEPK